MGKNRRPAFAYCALVAVSLGLTTCDAFKAGLGPKIDIAAPTVDVKSIANGAYLRGTVTLSGSDSDDVGVKSVTLIVNINSVQKASLPATISGSNWSVVLDTTGGASHIYGDEVQADLDIRVVDGSGKASDRKIVVYFDNTKPVVMSMSPTADNLGSSNYALSDLETVTGSVKDGLGLAQVEIDAGSLVLKDATHPAAWSITIDAKQFYDAATLAPKNGATCITPGVLYSVPYKVIATDLAGNQSDPIPTPTPGTLYINPNGSPIIDINGQTPAIGMSVPLYPNSPTPFLSHLSDWTTNSLSPGGTIKFRLFDMDGLDTSAAGLSLVLIPASKYAAVVAGTQSPAPYTYTVGGAAGNALAEADIMKLQPSGGGAAIPEEADFSLVLPSGLTGAAGTMPEYGEYALLIRAGDLASNKLGAGGMGSGTSAISVVPAPDLSGTRYLSLYITQGTPTVAVALPANGSFLNAFAASGSIDDALGPVSVSVAIDGTAQGDAVFDPGSGTHRTWTYAYSGAPLAEGLHSASFMGKNLAGQLSASAQTIQFNVDKTPPTASVQSAAPEGGANATTPFYDDASGANHSAPGDLVNVVNGVVKFKGIASDGAALASSSWKLWHVSSASPPPWAVDASPVDSGTFPAATMSLWSLDVDTTALINGDYYALSITAIDQAGNVSASALRTFKVDQSTDLPTFALQNMDAGAMTIAQAKNNLLNTKVELDATVADDDRVDPAMVKILIDPKNLSGNPDPSSYVTIANPADTSVHGSVNAATGSVSFAYSFATTGAGTGTALSEGRHFFYLVANDDSAWKGGKGAVASTMGPVYFAIDTHQPQISFDNAGGMYVNSSQALTGKVLSANALDNSLVSASPHPLLINGAAPFSMDDPTQVGTHAWSYTLDVSSMSEGDHSINAVAKDEFGLSATSVFNVTVDKSAPSVTPTNPAQYFSDAAGHGYALVGTVTDQYSGIASMTSTVSLGGVPVAIQPSLTWSATAASPNTTGNWSLDLSTLASSGTYTVVLTTTDKAGNGTTTTLNTINVDMDPPAATIDNLLGAPVNGAVYNAASALPASWTGTATDSFFKQGEVDLDGVKLGADLLGSGAWSRPLSIADGSHTLVVKATDQGGRSVTTTASFIRDTVPPVLTVNAPDASSWVGGATYTVKGTADDGAGMGVDKVYFKADAAAVDHSGDNPATWTLATGAVSWSGSINLAVLGEGSKKLWVKSVDKAGNWNPGATTVLFGVDFAPPNLSVTAPPANVNASTAAAFSGITGFAWDSNALAAASSLTATYSKNGSAPTTSAIAVIDAIHAGPGNAWIWTPFASGIDVAGHGDDGSYVFSFTATDAAGKATTSGSFNMTIDTALPTVSFSSPAAATSLNGLAKVSGSASDTNQVALVEYSLDGGASFLPVSGDKYTWSFSFDTRSAAQGGSPGLSQGAFALKVRSTDAAGNRSAIGNLPLVLDQVSDYPVISLTNMDQSKTDSSGAASNLQESNAKVQGSIVDDDWVDSTTIQYAVDGGAWADVASTGSSSASVNFSQSLTSLPDGIHYLSIRVSDTNDGANNRKGGLPAVQSTLAPVYFAVDKSNPVVVINAPASAYTPGPLSLTGTVTDGNRSMQVLVSTDGGATYSTTGISGFSGGPGSRAWAWNGNLSAKPEGPFDIKVKGIDEYNKETIADFVVTIDKTGPAMSIGSPALSSTVNGPVMINGQGVEPNGIDSVQIAITPQGQSPVGGDWFPAIGTYAWSYPFDSTSKADGAYTISVRGYDAAANVSPVVATRDFTINQASDRPVLSLATILAGGTYVQNLLPGSLQVSGTASDDDAVARASVQIRIDVNNDGDFNDGGQENWANVSGQPGVDANVVNWSHTVSGLADGKYRLEIRVADINFWSAHHPALDSADWTGVDTFKWTSSGAVNFAIDSAPPTGTVVLPAQGSYLSDPGTGKIRISGTASDGSGIQGVQIKVNGGTAQNVTDTGGATPFATWYYDHTMAGDGQVTYQVIVTDNFNKITTIDRYFTIDTTAPSSVFSQPTPGSTVNGALTIRGTSADTYQVSSVYLWIGAHGATPTGDPSTGDWTSWHLLSGTYNWQYAFDTRAFADGFYDAHVRTVDGAGNLAVDTVLPNIHIDQTTNYPVFSLTNLNASPSVNLFGAGGVITGTVADDDGIAASTIQISFDNGATWANASNQGSDGYTVSWSHAIPPAVLDSSAAYQVKVRASDIGQTVDAITIPSMTTTSPAYLVAVDRNLPSISIATSSIDYLNRYSPFNQMPSIAGAAMTGAKIFNNFTLKVDASSAAGLAAAHAVTVSVNGAAAADATYSVPDARWECAVPIDVAGHANDGNMTLAVTVTDTWGKVSTSTIAVVIDTTEPVLTFSQPAANSSVNGNAVAIAGTTFEAVGIAGMTIQGGLANASMPNTGTNQSWAATFDSNSFCNPASATINAMGMTTASGSGTLTTTSAYSLSVGDLVYFYGAALPPELNPGNPYYVIAANGGAKTFQVAAKPGGTLVTVSSTVSGVYVQKNGITWQFPITVTAVDTAGNKKTLAETVNIDPNSAKPVIVDATLMPVNGSSVAGTILLQSTVQGQNSPDHVLIYADLNDDGIITPGAYPKDLNANGNTTDPFEKEDIPLQVSITNGVWSVIADNNGEFSKANMIARGIAGATGWMQFQIVPYDSKGVAGNVSYRRVYIDSTAPAFGGLNFASGALVKGSIAATGWIEDDGLLGAANLQISFDGGTSFATLEGLAGPTVVGGLQHYTFSQPINTATINGGIFNSASGGGTLYAVLKATDATFKQTQVNLNLNVDNSPPQSNWNVPATLVPIQGVAGSGTEIYGFSGSGVSTARVFGKAIDTGAISGIDHVDVYFVKGTNFLDPKHLGTTTPQVLSVSGDLLYDQTGTTVQTGIPFTEDFYDAGGAGSHYAIKIDKRTELGQFDANGTLGDNDGFNESLQAKSGTPNYDEGYSYFDSTKLPDGPLTVYYVAYDQAGNKSFSKANAQVMNNPPSVLTFADHSQPTNYFAAATDGKIKIKYAGTFSLDIQATDSGANSGLDINWNLKRLTVAARYGATGGGDIDLASPKALSSWYYGSGGLRAFNATSATPLPATATIQVNTVSDGFIEGDWYQLTAQVTDNDGNIATKDLWMRVNNSDSQKPTITIDASTLTQAGSVGFWTPGQGPLQASIASANVSVANPGVFTYALPSWVGNGTKVAFAGTNAPGGFTAGTAYYVVSNTGSSFQLSASSGGAGMAATSRTGTYDLVSGGRTEAAGDSTYSARAAVSGSVLIFGTAYDNTDVASLTISIDGGAAQPLTLTSKTGDVLSGYTYNWSYLWDTSTVTGAAKANVSISLHATDAAANFQDAGTAADVLPYITSITDPTGLSADVLRGSTGRYSIRTDAAGTLSLRGFNFGAGSLAYVSPTAAAPTAGTSYTTTRDATYAMNLATVSKNIARSGYLSLVCATLPTINNLNKDLDAGNNVIRAYNMEQGADPRTNKWTDDRYLWVWGVTPVVITTLNGAADTTGRTFTFPDMVMNANQPEFSFVDDNKGFVDFTTSDTAATKRTGFRVNRFASMATASVNGTRQRFIVTDYDTTYGATGNSTGFLEVTGFGDQGATNSMAAPYGPSCDPADGSVNWMTLQGNDYYDGTNTNTYRVTNRFGYPKLIAETSTVSPTTAANIYVAFYDASTALATFRNINFVSFNMTGAATGNLTRAANDYRRSANVISIPGTANGNSSIYLDMAHVAGTTGIAIAYYDPTAKALKLAYSANAFNSTGAVGTDNLTNGAATWTTITVDSSADVGQYVSMTAGGGKLYISYYDFDNANLKLARLDWNGAGAPANATYATIDAYLSAGSWTNVSLISDSNLTGQAGAQPFIAYYSDSYNGTKKPIRMAFPKFDATTGALSHGTTSNGADDEYSGNWEVVAVPSYSPPKGGADWFQQTQLGVYTASTLSLPVLGWVGDQPEYAKLLPNN